MRVLHLVAASQLTGAAEPTLDFVHALRTLGVKVDLHVDTRREGNLRDVLRSRGEEVPQLLTLSTKAGPIAGAKDVLRLRKLLRSYDIVHVHLSHDHTMALLALGSSPRPLLVRTVHAVRVLRPGMGRRIAMRRAHGITVASNDHRLRVIENFGVDPANVLVIGGSVDRERFFVNPEARRRVRAELGVDDQTFVVGCVARFQAGRRHEVMLAALAVARREMPQLKLALIGHGETEVIIHAQIAKLGLEADVLLPGYKREDLNDWLNGLDAALWLVPGNDATSRAVLQAMAVALPVIGGRVDGIEEAIVVGETGLVVAPDDPAELAQALVQLARDRVRSREMGKQGLLRANEDYDPLARGRKTLKFYEHLLEKSRAHVLGPGS